MAKVAVVGAGAWGTALACHAARVGHDVVIWSLETEVADEINGSHRNTPYLAEVALPDNLSNSTVRTLLRILVEKGHLKQKLDGHDNDYLNSFEKE